MLRVLLAVMIMVLLAPSAQAEAQEWQRLNLVDLTRPSPENRVLREFWASEIALNDRFFAEVVKSPPPEGSSATAFALAASYEVQGGDMLVTTLLTGQGCNTGANDAASGATYAECPLRTAFRRTGGSSFVVLESVVGCYLDVDADEPDPTKRNRTGVFFSRKGDRIEIAGVDGGKRLPACDRLMRGR